MARAPRIIEPDGIYHVGARGVRRQRVFVDDLDWCRYVELLGLVVRDRKWACHAYCLMPNHVHLLVQAPDADISDGMHDLQLSYAKRFNQRYGFFGHVFESRFWSNRVDHEDELLTVARYVVLNPVRAGLCAAPADWRWSSYGATVAADAAAVLRAPLNRSLFTGDALRALAELE